MSKRQLEQLRQTLDSIVEDLCIREQAVDEEHSQLQHRLEELGVRQQRVESFEDVLCVHQATETDLVKKLEHLVGTLDEFTQTQPGRLASELQSFEARALGELSSQLSSNFESILENRLTQFGECLPAQLAGKVAHLIPETPPAPTLAEIVREIERVDARSLGTLTERLSASLQTAISVQLAPLSDDLPERLTAAIHSAMPAATGAPALALPELVRELEKFETRSMASLAARMTAGLQAAMATQLASLTNDLPSQIAAAVSAVVSPGSAAQSMASSTGASSNNAASDSASAARIDELAQELGRVKAALSETEALLVEALEHDSRAASHQDALQTHRRERQLDDELVEALRSEVSDLRSLLAAKEHDSLLVEELREEISALRAVARAEALDSEEGNEARDEILREQLERASCQIVELRTKNEDLSEQVAQLQINTSPHGPMPHLGQEGLSWEERKRLLLQQLDAEQSDEQPESKSKRVEVDEILRTTDAELARRDREIAELRSLLQQQSDARQGMAVGAAAVAQLIEGDELVQQEREKLRAIQRSWDEKLRQAEIDLSMERAKLARERLHLEEQKQQLEQELHSATAASQAEPNGKTADARSRKWLSRLGLKEET